jgi:hypothetical protein
MFDQQQPLHRQIEDVDPGWLKSECIAMARSAAIAVGLALMIGLAITELVSSRHVDGVERIVASPAKMARDAAAPTSCPAGSSRCASPATSR